MTSTWSTRDAIAGALWERQLLPPPPWPPLALALALPRG